MANRSTCLLASALLPLLCQSPNQSVSDRVQKPGKMVKITFKTVSQKVFHIDAESSETVSEVAVWLVGRSLGPAL